MFYSRSLTIPANTPILDPVKLAFPVTRGVSRHVWILWRWGSADLGGVRMKHQEFQHWPHTGAEWFPSTTHLIDFEDDIPITKEPLALTIEGYNLDDTHPHTVWVAFNIVRVRITPNMAQFLRDLEGMS